MITEKIPSLESAILTAPNEKLKVDSINQLAFEIRNSDTARSITLCKEAQKISTEINYPEGNATALANEAFCYVQIANYDISLEKSFEALNIFQEMQNEKGIALSHYNLTVAYQRVGDYNSALEHISKSFSYHQKVNDKFEMARCYLQLGFLYMLMNYKETSLEVFTQGLQINREINNKAGEAACIMGIGQTYLQIREYEKSREHLLKSMEIREQIQDWRGYAAAMNAYMTLCYETEKYEEAEKLSLKGIKMAEEMGYKMGVARFMVDLGKVYLKQNKIEEAERALHEALSIAEKINLKSEMLPAIFFLSEIYQKKGDFEKALKYYQRFYETKEEMFSTDSAMKAKSIQLAGKIEIAQKESEINRLKNVELKKAHSEIEEKNENITDSINYAKRIQQAKLPKREEIYSALPNSFVLFKPKAIVSGDFYFFSKNNKSIFIASADCTGHGVPGAFMSMLCSEKLEDAVSQSTDTSEILRQLNKGIKTSLRQSDSHESTRDGMDIALCSINTDSGVIKYAGANRPLWIIRNGQMEVEEIKATKKAIGGFTEDSQHFHTHIVQLQRGDTFYLSTDGYADTFGGQKNKKLTTKKFKQILLDIQHKTMQEQELHLENFLENWKAGTEQVDDILVIGIRL